MVLSANTKGKRMMSLSNRFAVAISSMAFSAVFLAMAIAPASPSLIGSGVLA